MAPQVGWRVIYYIVYVGSFLENYRMIEQENYPSFWKIDVYIQSAHNASVHPMWYDSKMVHE
jgi:hypothetical protein